MLFNEPLDNLFIYASGLPDGYSPAGSVSSIDIDESDVPTMFPFDPSVNPLVITRTGNVVTATFRVIQSCLYVD